MVDEAGAPNVRSMMESLQAQQTAQSDEIRRLGKISVMLSIGIVLVLLAFISLFLNTLAGNFAQERVTTSLQKHLPEMLPDLANGATQLVARVYPTYAELVRKEAVGAMPELTQAVETQADLLIEGLHKGTEARLHRAILDAFTNTGSPLRTAFPNATPDEVTKALDGFSASVEDDLVVVTNHIMTTHIGEILALQRTLSAFPTKGLPTDETALSKRLVHDLLGLLDLEVQEAK